MSGSKCPFHNLWARDTVHPTAEVPVRSKDTAPEAPASDPAPLGATSAPPSACPHAGAAASAAEAAGASQPAKCPLGFSSASGPKLSQFHCPVCKCLYFEPVSVQPCGHRFCAGCVRLAKDCPVCGADVEGNEPAEELREQVETYIQAHAGSHTIWELEGAAGPRQQQQQQQQQQQAADGSGGEERSRASFLMALGLRALAAGNAEAAAARLRESAAELEAALEEVGGSEKTGAVGQSAEELHLRLGTAYGALGDVARRGGDAGAALQRYEQSLRQLELAGDGAAALEARAVSVSKSGEVRHMAGDLEAAAGAYQRALDLRRRALAAADEAARVCEGDEDGSGAAAGEAAAAAALAVAASLVKLADARRSVAEASGAAEAERDGSEGGRSGESPAALLAEAGALLERVRDGGGGGEGGGLPPLLQRKLEVLEEFVFVGAEKW